MFGLDLDAWITILTIVTLMAAFLLTRLRSDVGFLGAVGILFVTGVLDTTEAFSGFVNSSVVIVGVMFVIATGLSRTGVLQWITKSMLGQPKGEVQALLHLVFPVALVSMFVYNVSVVALFVGVVKLWARKLCVKPSKLLIPLAFAGSMGGPLTGIVTPSTLLMFGMYEQQTSQSLGILAPTLPALVCFAVAVLVLIVFRRLLPDINSPESAFANTGDYTFEMLVTPQNRHVGKTVGELGLNHVRAGSLVELIHFDDNRILSPVDDDEPLMGGDRLIFSGRIDALMGFAKEMDFVSSDQPVLSVYEPSSKRNFRTAYLSFGSSLEGQQLRDTTFEQDNKMTLVAVSRKGERINLPPREVVLHGGDTLLFAYKPKTKINTDALASQLHFFDSPEIPITGSKPLISVAIVVGMVLLAATGIMSLLQSAFIAAGAMLLLGCCTPTQAMKAIKWEIIITLGGGIALGTALQNTGVASLLASAVLGLCHGHPLLVMIALCIVAAVVTEFVSNSAAVIMMFPIVYDAAMDLGCNPLPFVLALLLAVNAAFMTPVGAVPNLLVYGPGGYRAIDYLRIGLPVKLAYLSTAIIIICLLYDL